MFNLMQEFEKRWHPLQKEAEKLQGELDALTTDNSFQLSLRQLRAKVGVIDGEILKLTSEGEFQKVGKKEVEKKEITEHILNLTSERNRQIEDLKKGISSLLGQKKNIADEILREGFPSIQKEAWSHLEEAIEFIDSAWKEIENFQIGTGAAVPGLHSSNLKIYPLQQPELWRKLSKWVHVPVG